MDARSQKVSTALETNIDFDAWGEYLGDPPLAMAFLDRLVEAPSSSRSRASLTAPIEWQERRT
jgi:hypothetical protein